MAKIKTTVRVAGREYTLVGEESEEHIRRVAIYVDRKMEELTLASRLNAQTVAVLTAMNIADDLLKAQDENTHLRKELMEMQEKLKKQHASPKE